MSIPNVSNQNITDAFKLIDENGIPDKNKSTKYGVILADRKKYHFLIR